LFAAFYETRPLGLHILNDLSVEAQHPHFFFKTLVLKKKWENHKSQSTNTKQLPKHNFQTILIHLCFVLLVIVFCLVFCVLLFVFL